MKEELLAELSEEELAAPEYYPMDYALMWVAYSNKPINPDYAKILYDNPPKYLMGEVLKSAEKKLLMYLRSGKISAQTMGYKKNKEGNYTRTGKHENLGREAWTGTFNWESLSLHYPDAKGVWYECTEIIVNTKELLKCTPFEAKKESTKLIKKASQEQAILPKEKESLLKILLGLALTNYTFDPHSSRNGTSKEISNDLSLQGISIDEDTIRKWLNQAKEYLPDDWNSKS